jgi:aryl-alcohol dehydrogenase-like predicted oxidoreductase
MKRRLGRSGIDLPPVVFGGNVFGWTLDTTASMRMLDSIVDHGLTAIDTADVYSNWLHGNLGGESETIIGDWLQRRGRRDDILIATKVGMPMKEGGRGLSAIWISQAVENSLRRLKTDYIDIYQAHEDDLSVPLEETLAAFDRLIREGKVRAIGCSNYTPARLEEALRVSAVNGLCRFESVQPQYNLIYRGGFEGDMAALCEREEVGAITFFALAAGFLSGKYRSLDDLRGRARSERVAQFMTPANLKILEGIIKIAEAASSTPTIVALAWLMTRPYVTAPIVSATTNDQLAEIVSSTATRLPSDAIVELDRISSSSCTVN